MYFPTPSRGGGLRSDSAAQRERLSQWLGDSEGKSGDSGDSGVDEEIGGVVGHDKDAIELLGKEVIIFYFV